MPLPSQPTDVLHHVSRITKRTLEIGDCLGLGAYESGGDARDRRSVLDVTSNYSARADQGALADRDAAEDDGAGSERSSAANAGGLDMPI
jgi:hypothetical protein